MSDELLVEPIVYPQLPGWPFEVTIDSITPKAGNPNSKFARPDGTVTPRFAFVMTATDPELLGAHVWASVGQSWGKKATLRRVVAAALGKMPEQWELATFNIATLVDKKLGVTVRYKDADGQDSEFPRVVEYLSLRELAGTSKVPTQYADNATPVAEPETASAAPEPDEAADLSDIPF